MKYVQPVGAAANAPYVDANPGIGIEGSPVPAAAIEHPQREIENVITSAGLVPATGDLTQLRQAIVQKGMQGSFFRVAAAAGTADAISGVFTPVIAALSNGMALYVRAGSANATTTPTFTPAAGVIAAKPIVKGAGTALAIGDIAGAGHWLELQYDSTLDKWVLQNPAYGINSKISLPYATAFNASGTISQAAAGGMVYFYGATANQTITAPDASLLPNGSLIGILNNGTVPVTVARQGANAFVMGPTSAINLSFVLAPGDSILLSSAGSNSWLQVALSSIPKVFHVQDQRASGVAGQNSAALTWNIKTLQSTVRNEVQGASLAANQITLPAGTYDVLGIAIFANTAIGINNQHLRLRNITDGATTLVGVNQYAGVVNAASTPGTSCTIQGRIVLAAAKAFELQHYCNITSACQAVSSGEYEVYSNLVVTKVA